ncbi:hypothetical protein HYX12_02055 [Candidatus Woesearchaeota archaeon]|nr:hypothetical protein [Candidatus Woesearchaeota archaeon]
MTLIDVTFKRIEFPGAIVLLDQVERIELFGFNEDARRRIRSDEALRLAKNRGFIEGYTGRDAISWRKASPKPGEDYVFSPREDGRYDRVVRIPEQDVIIPDFVKILSIYIHSKSENVDLVNRVLQQLNSLNDPEIYAGFNLSQGCWSRDGGMTSPAARVIPFIDVAATDKYTFQVSY